MVIMLHTMETEKYDRNVGISIELVFYHFPVHLKIASHVFQKLE